MKFKPELQHNLVLLFIFIALLFTACSTPPPTPETGTNMPALTNTPGEEGAENIPFRMSTAIAERTPIPTSTPGVVDREIEKFYGSLGWGERSFLGIRLVDLFELAILVLVLLICYFILVGLLNRSLKWIANKTNTDLSNDFYKSTQRYLNWIIMLLLVRFGILQVDFLRASLRGFIYDLTFTLEIGILTIIVLNIINYGVHRYRANLKSSGDLRNLDPVIVTAERIAQFAVLIFAASIILSHLGIEINILVAVLVIVALAVSLGARDVLADAISGFIILIDQPFRVGDDILIEDLGTWGVVLEIGARSTRIRTRDNREVIVPNGKISQSQVTNYSFPDPSFRVETIIGVAYGSDFDQIHRVIESTVRQVDGVLHDKPINIYFTEFGASARVVRIRWWIESRKYKNPSLNSVNQALELALSKAGIILPNDTMDLNVEFKNEMRGPNEPEKSSSVTQDKGQNNQIESN